MLGQEVVYDRLPYFYTDQYDLGMEYSGYVEPGGYDEVVFRGDKQRREFVAFWLSEGRVLAGMNVNVWDVNDAVQALIRRGSPGGHRQAGQPGHSARRDRPLGDRAPLPLMTVMGGEIIDPLIPSAENRSAQQPHTRILRRPAS